MCGSAAGCGGGLPRIPAADLQAQLDHGLRDLQSAGFEPTQGGGSGSPAQKHAHSATQAGGGAKLVAGGDVRGAWGTNATFQASSGSAEIHHHGTGGAGHSKTIYTRTTANDMALSNRVMQAAMQLLAPLDYAKTADGSTKDHLSLPASVKQAWAQQFPDLPVPNKVVFDTKSGTAVGALFVGGQKAKDLGMGTAHAHEAGGPIMQHMWFIPNDMHLAFSDVSQKQAAIRAAVAR